MPGVFISYRKDDTRAWAIALHDLLGRALGAANVFLDVDSLDAGHWRTQIERALDGSAVVLVLVGSRWTTAVDGEGRRRLFQPDDVHRQEVAWALSRPELTVIPVLVDGARLPVASELPSELHALLECSAATINDAGPSRAATMRDLTRPIDQLSGQRRERRRATAIAVSVSALATINTLVSSASRPLAFFFLLAAAGHAAFAWPVYRRMARGRMRSAWVAVLALTLSVAMLAGSLARIAAE